MANAATANQQNNQDGVNQDDVLQDEGHQHDHWDLPVWSVDTFDVEKEIQRNPMLRQEDIDELREWVARQRSLPEMRDADFAKFLHSCDYDVLAAMQCINNYFRARASNPGLFHDRDIRLEKLRAQCSVLDYVVVPRLAPDGCRIIIHGLTDPDPMHYEFEDSQKVLLMMIDAILLAEPTLPGVYVIYDLRLGLLSHFWKFGFFSQRKLFSYLANGLPMVLKGVILLNTPSFIQTVMSVLKKIGDKKRLEEAKMFGDDYTEVYKLIPKECLPSDYGGTLPSRKQLHEMTLQRLELLTDHFAEEEAALKRK